MTRSTKNLTIANANSAVLLLVALLAVSGCRSVDNAQLDLLERELRQQEAYIYELEDYLVEYSEKLRQCRCTDGLHLHTMPDVASDPTLESPAGSSTKQSDEIPEPELADDSPREEEGPVPELADEPLPEPATEEIESAKPPGSGEPETIEPETFDPETIDVEELEDPGLEIGPTSALPESPRARLAAEQRIGQGADAWQGRPDNGAEATEYERVATLDQTESAAAFENAPPTMDAERRMPEQLVIRQVLADDAAANASVATETPTGLLVVVEALNALGEPVDIDGEASLMVLTPEGDQPQRRVDRWDFNPNETGAAWQSSILGDGLHLQLPLDRRPLTLGSFELWARVVTGDGRKLLAKRVFQTTDLATLAEAEAGQLAGEIDGATQAPSAERLEAEATYAAAPQPVLPEGPDDAKLRPAGTTAWRQAANPLPPAATQPSSSTGPRWKRSSQRNANASNERWTPF